MIYFTSDLHLGHANAIEFKNRPFSNVEEMNQALIQNINDTVSAGDELWILGDFSYKINKEEVRKLRKQIMCKRVHLVYGNHDNCYSSDHIFQSVQHYKELKTEYGRVVLFHYPILEWSAAHYGSIHLHGHIHSTGKYNEENLKKKYEDRFSYSHTAKLDDLNLRIYDVGVDANEYRPISLDRIAELMHILPIRALSMHQYLQMHHEMAANDASPQLLDRVTNQTSYYKLNQDCTFQDIVVGGLLGLAVGDAFGVPVEFMSRTEVRKINLQEMEGNDTAPGFWSTWTDEIPRGAWSDDTSMTVATMCSVISRQGRIDYDDIMRQFQAWWYEGKYTSLDYPFGLGNTVSNALMRYRSGTPALECGGRQVRDNGNGALMRIFPFSVYCIKNGYEDRETLQIIRNGASLTHGHDITAMSCFLYTLFLRECIATKNPEDAYNRVFGSNCSSTDRQHFSDEAIRAHEHLFSKNFVNIFDPDTIPPESGYVVDSLTTVIYSILHTHNYEDAVKMAVNFGYDTDTNAAITGSIAGAMYGKEQIPERWLRVLRKKNELIQIGEQFAECI